MTPENGPYGEPHAHQSVIGGVTHESLTPIKDQLAKSQRRTRILLALDEGEFLATTIAAWAELSDQATRADLKWLSANGFAEPAEDDGRWGITDQGRAYLLTISDSEKTW